MAYEEQKAARAPHSLSLAERERLSVSGVEDVLSFDENEISMRTTRGDMTVRGSGLKVGRLSVDTGDIALEGEIDEIVYSQARESAGLWTRLFG